MAYPALPDFEEPDLVQHRLALFLSIDPGINS